MQCGLRMTEFISDDDSDCESHVSTIDERKRMDKSENSNPSQQQSFLCHFHNKDIK